MRRSCLGSPLRVAPRDTAAVRSSGTRMPNSTSTPYMANSSTVVVAVLPPEVKKSCEPTKDSVGAVVTPVPPTIAVVVEMFLESVSGK